MESKKETVVKVRISNSRIDALKAGYAEQTREIEIDLTELTERQRECLAEFPCENGVYSPPRYNWRWRDYTPPTIVKADRAAVITELAAVDAALKRHEQRLAEERAKESAKIERRVAELLEADIEELVILQHNWWTTVWIPEDPRLTPIREAAEDLAKARQEKREEERRAKEAQLEAEREEFIEHWIHTHGSKMLQAKRERGYNVTEEVRKLFRNHTFRALAGCQKYRREKRSTVCPHHPDEVVFSRYNAEEISDSELSTILAVEEQIEGAVATVQSRWGQCEVCMEEVALPRTLNVEVETPLGPVGRTFLLEDGKLVDTTSTRSVE